VAKKEAAKARAGKNSFPPQPPSFLPARAFSFGSAELRSAISQDFVKNGF